MKKKADLVIFIILVVASITIIVREQNKNNMEYYRQLQMEYPVIQTETVVYSPIPTIAKTMEVTAYTDGYESTGKTPDHPLYGVTASGQNTKADYTIAMGRSYPFGTQVYIPALNKVYTCTDRGGAITDNHIDIYIPNLKEAKAFGRQQLTVYIIGKEEN